jgi:hypothetical protein
VTRIPELEQELVTAAARLQSPRRVLRPGVRAALAAAALAVVVALLVVDAAENDRDDGGRRPTGNPSQRSPKVAIDVSAGVRFSLDGRVLTASLLTWAPFETHQRVSSALIRASCGVAFAQVAPEGDPRNAREEVTRLWPAGRKTMRFRFPQDIPNARWCRLEDPAVGHVGFVQFGTAPARVPSPQGRVKLIANDWALLFAASDPATCEYMVQPACQRMDCIRVGNRPIENCTPPSQAFRTSFRGARVEAVEIGRDEIGRDSAGVRFSNGRTIQLVLVEGPAPNGVWWVESFRGNAGRQFFEK